MFLFDKQTVGMGGRFADAGSPCADHIGGPATLSPEFAKLDRSTMCSFALLCVYSQSTVRPLSQGRKNQNAATTATTTTTTATTTATTATPATTATTSMAQHGWGVVVVVRLGGVVVGGVWVCWGWVGCGGGVVRAEPRFGNKLEEA